VQPPVTSDTTPHYAWSRLAAGDAIRVTVNLEARPTPRPRVTRHGIAFLPKPYAEYAGELQRELSRLHDGPPLKGLLVVRVDIAKQRPKTTVLAAPRGDVDNLAKGVLDAATKTGRYWADDVQIVHLFATKRWSTHPAIELTLNTVEARDDATEATGEARRRADRTAVCADEQ